MVVLGSWTCGRCGTNNRATVDRCSRCGRRPAYNPYDLKQVAAPLRWALYVSLTIGVAVLVLWLFWLAQYH